MPAAPDVKQEFYSAQDIAVILGVSEDFALKLITKMEHVVVGFGTKRPRLRVAKAVFYDYIGQHTRNFSAQPADVYVLPDKRRKRAARA